MKRSLLMVFGVVCLFTSASAHAHQDAGDRTFPTTLQFDDPGVGDELTLPQINTFKGIESGEPARRETSYEAEFERRLTDDFELFAGGSYLHEGGTADDSRQNGFDDISVGAKYQFYQNDAHEFVMSAGIEDEIGGSGNHDVSDNYSTITPGLFFGKGLNELPYNFKPLAVTGNFEFELPTDRHSDGEHNDKTLETNLSLQYSLPYLQQQGTEVAPFFAGLTPIVEFHYETPFGSDHTTGTINPGVIWSNDELQVGVEATLPGMHDSGQGVGGSVQLHFFLDEMVPSLFGKPVFGN